MEFKCMEKAKKARRARNNRILLGDLEKFSITKIMVGKGTGGN